MQNPRIIQCVIPSVKRSPDRPAVYHYVLLSVIPSRRCTGESLSRDCQVPRRFLIFFLLPSLPSFLPSFFLFLLSLSLPILLCFHPVYLLFPSILPSLVDVLASLSLFPLLLSTNLDFPPRSSGALLAPTVWLLF